MTQSTIGTAKAPTTVVGVAFVEWVLKGRALEDSEIFAAELHRHGLGDKPRDTVIRLVKEALIARSECDHRLADLAEGYSADLRSAHRLGVLAAHQRMEELREKHEQD